MSIVQFCLEDLHIDKHKRTDWRTNIELRKSSGKKIGTEKNRVLNMIFINPSITFNLI